MVLTVFSLHKEYVDAKSLSPPPQYVVVWNENVLYFYLLLYFPKDFNKVVFRNPGNRNHPLVVWKNPEPGKIFVLSPIRSATNFL